MIFYLNKGSEAFVGDLRALKNNAIFSYFSSFSLFTMTMFGCSSFPLKIGSGGELIFLSSLIDETALTSGGRRAARDIVQFVAFRDFTQKAGINAQHSAFELARAVLQEIPQQLVSFMTANEKKPPNRR